MRSSGEDATDFRLPLPWKEERLAGKGAGGIGIFLFLAGCHSPAPTADTPAPTPADRSAGAFAQTDPWRLTTTDPNAARGNHGIFLGNGDIGTNVGADGYPPKPAAVFRAGSYDAQENFTSLSLLTDPPSALHAPASPYSQTLDVQHGTLMTRSGATTTISFLTPGGKSGSDHLGIVQSDRSKEDTSKDVTVVAQQERWKKNWQDADIQIDGDPEAQQLVHKLMFDLLQSTHPGASDSIPPESLSGNFYKGHIFWDAEVWMFPALLAQHPDYAKSILDYRFKHLPQAREIARAEGCAGADFPWESAASGKEVAPGGFSEGRHVTAGVGWAAWQYYLATGDKVYLKTEGWPLLSAVADYWATRAKLDPTDGKYHARKVFGPDENKGTVDDNTYTNAMARNCLLAAADAAKIVGQPTNPAWATIAAKIALPFDATHKRYLTRANDDGAKTKQADGELVIYPAELPMDKSVADATYEFQSKRPIQNGPAMTASVHALIAARLGKTQEAEQAFRDSYRPFVRGPFLLFSEKRSLDRCVFTTGAGGVLQAVLYGFGGLDFAHWDQIAKTPVCLPPTWRKLTITGIKHGGKRYTLTVMPQGRTLTPTP